MSDDDKSKLINGIALLQLFEGIQQDIIHSRIEDPAVSNDEKCTLAMYSALRVVTIALTDVLGYEERHNVLPSVVLRALYDKTVAERPIDPHRLRWGINDIMLAEGKPRH